MVKVRRRASFAVLVITLLGLYAVPTRSSAAGQELIATTAEVEDGQLDDAQVYDLREVELPVYRPEGQGKVKAVRSCDVTIAASGSNAGLIDATYCQLLQRLPEDQGLTYWGSQLDSGLPLVRLLARIQQTEEYQSNSDYSMLGTLNKITISDERSELLSQAKAKTEAETHAAQAAVAKELAAKKKAEADAARRAADKEAKRREATLLKRQPMSTKQFNEFAANRGFASSEYLTPSLVHGTYKSTNQRVNVLLVHLSGSRGFSVSPGDRAKSTVGSWATDIQAQAAVNGNWFGPYDGPAVSSGKVYGGKDHGYTSLFGITLQKDLIMEHHSRVNTHVDDRIAFGVSGHPTLIFQGTKTTDFGGDPTFTNREPRTAMGANSQGDVLIFVTVDGRSASAAGMTGAETANLMAKLGAANAVMLDGGGSSTMWIAGRGVVNQPSDGQARPVANQIAIFGT